MSARTPQWLAWARRLQALAQNGLAYANNPFDVERYALLRFFDFADHPEWPTDFD